MYAVKHDNDYPWNGKKGTLGSFCQYSVSWPWMSISMSSLYENLLRYRFMICVVLCEC